MKKNKIKKKKTPGNFIKRLAHAFPDLQLQLNQAGMHTTDLEYLQKAVKTSFSMGLGLGAIFFFLFRLSPPKAILVWILGTSAMFFFFLRVPKAYIVKKKKEIDKNILFAGQYLLVKIESGEPLYNTLEGVSESFGETGKAFKEIVRYITFGDSIEKAIDRGVANSPSKNFQKLLWEISNSVKTGTDIKRALKAILRDIQSSYLIEIEKYGKKLNSITLFYMVIGIIVPSLGLTMFVIISSFIQLNVPFAALMAALFGLSVLHFFFISIFKSIRPAVDL